MFTRTFCLSVEDVKRGRSSFFVYWRDNNGIQALLTSSVRNGFGQTEAFSNNDDRRSKSEGTKPRFDVISIMSA